MFNKLQHLPLKITSINYNLKGTSAVEVGGKRPKIIESQTHFSKQQQQQQQTHRNSVKMTKIIFGKVRKALGNMSVLTSEKGLV